MDSNKMNRLNSEIMKNISITLNQKLNNPNIPPFISVNKVSTTHDLKLSHIYISSIGTQDELKKMLDIIQSAKSFIRGELSRGVALRCTPDLIFHLDSTNDYGDNIDKLLRNISIPKDEDENE